MIDAEAHATRTHGRKGKYQNKKLYWSILVEYPGLIFSGNIFHVLSQVGFWIFIRTGMLDGII